MGIIRVSYNQKYGNECKHKSLRIPGDNMEGVKALFVSMREMEKV